jgi:hypothetical protein
VLTKDNIRARAFAVLAVAFLCGYPFEQMTIFSRVEAWVLEREMEVSVAELMREIYDAEARLQMYRYDDDWKLFAEYGALYAFQQLRKKEWTKEMSDRMLYVYCQLDSHVLHD